ncbi:MULTISPECIES: hypothetical protein [unclassified Novosphingobium]|uniref:hypothetical protein n=1 Tax=unclassified Novosphingobium TaxID=2644732 RepID=UPI00146B79FE|nr:MULTISPECIES: hypothetical protein [unclassified Novosphingobium]NMN06802.1 hypothetical protein [Novosphingobium sp. SG919]NMN88747.1 hypothetical protein [Novosphingobium sp. SG916]
MKGKILGFTPSSGTGTITGEDGSRYGFSQAEWRSDKPITAGSSVDFELRGSEAIGIYPVAPGIDVAALSSSPAVAKARSLATGTLAFPVAILLLIASIMPAINSLARGGQSLSLLGLGPVVTELSQEAKAERAMAEGQTKDLDEREQQLQRVIASTGPGTPIGMFGSGGSAGDALKELQEERTRVAASQKSRLGAFLLSFMWLVYAVPLLALALIGLSWTGRSVRTASLAAGILGVIAFALLWNLTALATVGDGISMLTLGFGAWIILLASVALGLSGLGKIRNPLAAS